MNVGLELGEVLGIACSYGVMENCDTVKCDECVILCDFT